MRPTFILGCQRSGTTALLAALARSPEVRAFEEGDPELMLNYRLLSAAALARVCAATPAKSIVAKPICDSHYADALLQLAPDARVVWLYRNPTDVAESITRKWPGHMREVVQRLHDRDLGWTGWRSERLEADQWAVFDSVWRPDLSDVESAAIFWCLRNEWFFRLGLDHHPRVLLIRYEDLVRSAAEQLARIFAFARIPYETGFASDLTSEHVGKASRPEIAPAIAKHCTELLAQLDLHARTSAIETC